MKGLNLLGAVGLAMLGVAGIKLYGEYKYHCGREDSYEFYEPIMDAMRDTIVQMRINLDKKEG